MIKHLLKINTYILVGIVLLFIFLPLEASVSVLAGFGLGFIFVLTSAWVHSKFLHLEEERFTKFFYRSILIRFFFIVVFLIIILSLSKIDELYFTVSFIISYLYNSVAEMILFNQTLTNKSKK